MPGSGRTGPRDAERAPAPTGPDSPPALLGDAAADYAPRSPERTLLHRIVRDQLETFLAQARRQDQPVPRFVEEELRAYLRCGVLAHAFLRVHCDQCGLDRLVPFSCKRRGFCPSCGGRRMADTAAHLVDCLFPDVPVRQWVLTLPYPLRYRCLYDSRLTSEVLRAFLRALFAELRRRARRRWSIRRSQCGAVTFIQRFGSALNANLHFHTLVLDGVYARAEAQPARFLALPPPSGPEVARVLAGTARRIVRRLEARAEATTTRSPATSPCSPRWPAHRCAPASRAAPRRGALAAPRRSRRAAGRRRRSRGLAPCSRARRHEPPRRRRRAGTRSPPARAAVPLRGAAAAPQRSARRAARRTPRSAPQDPLARRNQPHPDGASRAPGTAGAPDSTPTSSPGALPRGSSTEEEPPWVFDQTPPEGDDTT